MIRIYFLVLISCFCFTSCKSQERVAVLDEIRDRQKSYYDNEIKDKENYSSVISFASQVEKSLTKKASDILQSKSFVILEGFSPGGGNFQGLIWNDHEDY